MVDFLVIGYGNVVCYKNIFPLFRDKKVFFGHRIMGGRMYFSSPYEKYGKLVKKIDDVEYVAVTNVKWLTSIPVELPGYLDLTKKYKDGDYKWFDNGLGINVDSIRDIPVDYEGVMGVPMNFMDWWCREQFDVVGLLKDGYNGVSVGSTKIDGKEIYVRILIKKK